MILPQAPVIINNKVPIFFTPFDLMKSYIDPEMIISNNTFKIMAILGIAPRHLTSYFIIYTQLLNIKTVNNRKGPHKQSLIVKRFPSLSKL